MQHRRKYETFDKAALYIAGVAVTTLMAMQVNLTAALSESTRLNQIQLAEVSLRIESVITNQSELQQTVKGISRQTVLTCDRLKILYPERGYECR